MISMGQLDFEKMLNAICYSIWLNEENKRRFDYLGIDFNHWPKFVKSKLLMAEFFYHVEKESYDFAQIMLSEKFVALEKIAFPEDDKDLRVTYQENLKRYQAIDLAHEILGSPEEVNLLISEFQSSKATTTPNARTLEKIIPETLGHNQKLIQSGNSKLIIPAFPLLSDVVGGFNPGRISIISAKSGFGKTKLAINIAQSASEIMPVLYVNMEMTEYDFSAMFIQRSLDLTTSEWSSGNFNLTKIENYQQHLKKNHPIYLTNGKTLTLHEIEAEALSIFKDAEKGIIIVDYDQKLTTGGAEREWFEILKATESLESLSKRLNVHTALLVQGDDVGSPKSSKRALQPVSFAISFCQDIEQRYVLRCLKNRFGPNCWDIEVEYNAAVSKIKEKYFIDEIMKRPSERIKL